MTWYLQAVERARPDVLVLYEGSLGRPWYRRRLESAAPAAARWLRGEGPAPGPVYADFGVGAPALPPELRARLVPAGLWLRVGGAPRPRDPDDWLAGRRDLDLETRRALVWLHFRRLCFHAERDQGGEAAWHAAEADRLEPGVALAARLRGGDLGPCRSAVAGAPRSHEPLLKDSVE
jgi:hypothetical protein